MQIGCPIYIFLIYYLFESFFLLFNHHIKFAFANEILGEPKIAYIDGNQPWNDCRPGLKRSLNALTGLLISHHQYGSSPYNSSRNCFLTIAVPIGYRVRLKALDFDVQGRWRHCEDEDTLHVFDHDRPLEPKLLAAEEPMPIGGHSPGKILGEFCGKMPPKDSKTNRHKHFVLAESSQNALTLWWHSEPQKEEEGRQNSQQTTILPPASRPFAQGYRLLWSSFRHIDGGQCRPKSNQSGGFGEFQCDGRDPIASASTSPNGPHHSSSLVECIPSPLGCNSNADCADGTDLDAHQQLFHGCQHIPNDPLSLLTSSGPKRLLLVGALVLLWLSICLGCSCCLVHHRRRRQKNKRGIGNQHFHEKMYQNRRQNAFKNIGGNGAGMMEANGGEERGQMILANNPVSHHPFSFTSSCSEFPSLPAPSLPPPSFSPPAIPKNRPPPAPAININKSNNFQQRHQQIGQQFNSIDQQGQKQQNQKVREKRRQRQSAGYSQAQKQHSNSQQSASSSSSSHQHPIMLFSGDCGVPLPPQQLNRNSAGADGRINRGVMAQNREAIFEGQKCC